MEVIRGVRFTGAQGLAHLIALDQASDHHVLRSGMRDAGLLPIRIGGETKEQDALVHRLRLETTKKALT